MIAINAITIVSGRITHVGNSGTVVAGLRVGVLAEVMLGVGIGEGLAVEPVKA